jgi:hypothetical protein
MALAIQEPASHAVVELGPSGRLAADDLATLREAYRRLEHESLAARLSSAVGRQIELAGSIIPDRAKKIAERATQLALRTAMRLALRSLGPTRRPASLRLHKSLAAASGAAGGAFGLAALPFELPVSTTLILRAIADVARSEGEDVGSPEAALACMEVFALGARREGEDAVESSYFAVRSLLAKSISEAARFVVQRGLVDETAPVLVKFIGQIAARFGVAVTQKIAAQALPVIGAIGGAAVNFAFVDHFQSLAGGHFAMRRLERLYGADLIRAEYERLRVEDDARAARARRI